METENFKKARAVFEQAIEIKDPAERQAYLDEACANDLDLRKEVNALLVNHDKAREFLESPFFTGIETRSKQTLQPEGPGSKIGHYELLKQIGEGGMGLVYLAQQKQPVKRQVALKIIKPGMDSKEVIARFDAERQALALLEHPNIAHVFDAGTTEAGRPYFIMEYVRGMSITRYCDDRKLSIEQRLQLFKQVCEGLHYAHQKGIIHRDIKPSNILVSVHGDRAVPKIIDFGIAKAAARALTEKTVFTLQGQLLGTPEYMSPEQVDFATQDIDTRSDIYSLGVLLYELLTGVLPFDGKTFHGLGFAEIQRTIREQEPATPSTRFSNLGKEAQAIATHRQTQVVPLARCLHRELEWIPMKAMRKDRVRRYRSASEFADDIQNYLNGSPLIAGPETAMYKARKFVRRHAGSVATASLVAVVIILGLISSILLGCRAEQAREKEATLRVQVEKALVRAENAEKAEREQRQLAEQMVEDYRRLFYANSVQLAASEYREGTVKRAREILDNCPNDLRAWEWHYLDHISDESIMTLHANAGPVHSIDLSSNGEKLVAGNKDGTLTIWNLKDGADVVTLKGHERRVYSVAFGPNDGQIVSGDIDGKIKIWDTRQETEIATLHGLTSTVMTVSFSPNGERILSRSADDTIRLWDADSHTEILSIPFERTGMSLVGVAYSPDGNHFSYCDGPSIRICNSKDGLQERSIPTTSPIEGLSYSTDGERIVSWGEKIKIWDAVTGSEILAFTCDHRGRLRFAAFNPNGTQIVTCGGDSVIKVWDALTGSELMALRGHKGTATNAIYHPDGQRILSCGGDGEVKIWSTVIRPGNMKLRGHEGPVWAIAFSPDGRHLATGSRKTLKLWDVETCTETMTMEGLLQAVNCVTFSPDGRQVVSGNSSGIIKVWDTANGRRLRTYCAHEDSVGSVVFSPDGRHIVSSGGATDPTVKVWDSETGELTATCQGHTGHIDSLSVSSDGKRIFSAGCCDPEGDTDGTIRVWDVTTGNELLSFSHGSGVPSMAISPDSSLCASGGSDNRIKIWNTNDGTLATTLKGHDAEVYSLAFGPDGMRILSGSRDETFRLWDVKKGVQVWSMPVRGSWIRSAVFSPDGKTIAVDDGNSIALYESAKPRNKYQPRVDGETARRLVDGLHQELGYYNGVIEHLKIKDDSGGAAHRLALQIANSRLRGDAIKLTQDSRKIIRVPGKDEESYKTALEQMEKARDLLPSDWVVLNILAAAQYRVHAYEDALDTLTTAVRTLVDTQKPRPFNTAFTAMALHQLGRLQEAQESLDKLRDQMKVKMFSRIKELQALLAEVEKLCGSQKE
jgi:eukaryotic-like serine/threonine-protein kinase